MLQHAEKIRIYYKDTDAGGVVYHTRYAEFMEITRTELLRKNGFSASVLLDEYGIISPVVHLSLDYKKPIYYDELIDVECVVKEITQSKVIIEYQIKKENEELCCYGKTINCGVDRETFKLKRFPRAFIDKIKNE